MKFLSVIIPLKAYVDSCAMPTFNTIPFALAMLNAFYVMFNFIMIIHIYYTINIIRKINTFVL